MTDETLKVEQRHRDAAADRLISSITDIFPSHPAHATANSIRAGQMDGHPWVQAFVRFEASLRPPPADSDVERVATALYEHWVEEDELSGAEYAPWETLGDKETWRSRARAALTSIPDRAAIVEAGWTTPKIMREVQCSPSIVFLLTRIAREEMRQNLRICEHCRRNIATGRIPHPEREAGR